ncbi:Ionotropic receptor 656 [Blattella germanica]|nr:Ionotropic receptor 656 [Blattella germanica]
MRYLKSEVTSTIIFAVIIIMSMKTGNTLSTEENNLLLCLEYIVKHYFFLGRSVMVSFTDKSISYTKEHRSLLTEQKSFYYEDIGARLMRQLNEELGWATQTTLTYGSQPIMSVEFMQDTDKHHNYIIFVPTLEEEDRKVIADAVENVIDDYNEQVSLNIHGKYVIVIVDKGIQSPRETALAILTRMCKWWPVHDSLVIIPHKGAHDAHTLQLYTRFPLEPNGQRAILLDEWLMEKMAKLQKGNNLFPSKIPSKFSTKPLQVQMLADEPVLYYKGKYTDENKTVHHLYEGPEIDILNMITGHLNLSLNFSEPYTYGSLVDRIWAVLTITGTGIVVNMTIGSLPLHPKTIDWMEFSHPYLITGLTWFVPCPKQYPRLKKIAETFPREVWATFFLVLIITACIIHFISLHTFRKDSSIFNSLVMCFYCMWAVILGVSVPDMPHTSIIRSLFLLFVWYAFVMNTLFQTFFTSYLVDPGIIDQIRTIDALLNASIPMGYYRYAHNYLFPDKTDPIETLMKSRGENCDEENYKTCLLKVIIGQNYSTLRSEFHAEYFVKTTMPSKRNPLCSLDHRFTTFYICAYFQKRSPYLKSFNSILRRIDEAGLLTKRLKDFKESWRYEISDDASKYDVEENDDYFVFSLEYMLIAFYSLVAGCALSSAVFIAESIFSMIHELKSTRMTTPQKNDN